MRVSASIRILMTLSLTLTACFGHRVKQSGVLTEEQVAAEQAAWLQATGRKEPAPADSPWAYVRDEPGAPRVLLIGDSISIGYTVAVREAMAGEANIHRIPENGGHTQKGLDKLEAWLGDRPWDVIHFNWGLHDIKSVDEKGQLDPNGVRLATDAEYEANLEELVRRLKKTGAQLIWAATTPVPEGARGRTPGDEVRANAIAARIMKKYGVPVNDLYNAIQPHVDPYQRKADVHFTDEGSKFLGDQVVQCIREVLN